MVFSRLGNSEITANWLNTQDRAVLGKGAFPHSIYALIHMSDYKDDFMSTQLDDDRHKIIVRGYNRNYGYIQSNSLISILKFHKSEIIKIFGVVRQKILSWALESESQGILGDEWIFTDKDKQMASHNTDSMINQTAQNLSVTKGDFQSLANFLNDRGISEPDIQELKKLLMLNLILQLRAWKIVSFKAGSEKLRLGAA
ncbi:unnamed protein product [Commensalibacter communis]|uniref:AbiTii domain-containing protein n=1 Tax=Commensalibacter communis TaxID=2972786 RepID=UPI0022FF75C7|nr:hypothetical protein [Commensalibacter communis]CAI3937381.1 unnamed protein product [Commensalibacter communis]CAI3938604.1 unnamed protein product [Commensalibacter communis]